MKWQDQVAEYYEQSIKSKISGYEVLHHNMERMLAGYASKHVQEESQHLLVVGAGGGYELSLIGKRHPSWHLTGVDSSPTMLEAARKRIVQDGLADRVHLVEGYISDLQQTEAFHAATCMLVLHFVKGTDVKLELLKEIALRLQPGGILLLATICGDLQSEQFQLQMAGWKQHMLLSELTLEDWERFAATIGTQTDIVTANEIEHLLSEAGFTTVSCFFSSFLIVGFCAIKGGDQHEK